MANDVAITLQFENDEWLIEFPTEGITVSVPLALGGDRLFRLDGVPVFAESATFGDVIEIAPAGNGRLRFVRVAEPGGWRTFGYTLPASCLAGAWVQSLLSELTAHGGHWERVCGGMLFVCIPPGLDLDPTPWVATLI